MTDLGEPYTERRWEMAVLGILYDQVPRYRKDIFREITELELIECPTEQFRQWVEARVERFKDLPPIRDDVPHTGN